MKIKLLISFMILIVMIISISCNSNSNSKGGRTKGRIINVIDAFQQTKEKQENERIKRGVKRVLRDDFKKICETKRICLEISYFPTREPLVNLASYKLGFLSENEITLNLKKASLLFDKLEQENSNSVVNENTKIQNLKINRFKNKQKLIDIEVSKYNKLLDICESVITVNCK